MSDTYLKLKIVALIFYCIRYSFSSKSIANVCVGFDLIEILITRSLKKSSDDEDLIEIQDYSIVNK